MSHMIEIEFADGERASYEAPEAKTILLGASACGVRLAYDCKQGQCQACRLELVQGSVRYADRARLTLTAAQEADGYVLPCQGFADSSLHLRAPYARASLLPVKQKAVEVVSVEDAGPGAISVLCRFGQHSKFEHLPGQYVRLGAGTPGEERSYSMTTCTADWPNVGFLVRRIPGGSVSGRLSQLQPGEKLTVKGPHGTFYLRDGERPLLWVAGGTGLAPFLSMLSSLKHAGRTDRDITLCFGVTAAADLCWPSGTKELLQAFPRLKLLMAMARPIPGWTGITGTAVDALATVDMTTLAQSGAQAYLCGPPLMVAAARDSLGASGFTAANIFNEEFQPSLQA